MTLLKKTKMPAKKLPMLQLRPKQTRPWSLRTKKRKETAQLKNPTSGKGNVDTRTTNLLPVQIQNLRNLLQVLLLRKIKKVMALKMPIMGIQSKMKKLKRIKTTTKKKMKMTLKKLMRTRTRKPKKKTSKWTTANPNLELCTKQHRFFCVTWHQLLPSRRLRLCAKGILDFSEQQLLIHNLNEGGSEEVG